MYVLVRIRSLVWKFYKTKMLTYLQLGKNANYGILHTRVVQGNRYLGILKQLCISVCVYLMFTLYRANCTKIIAIFNCYCTSCYISVHVQRCFSFPRFPTGIFPGLRTGTGGKEAEEVMATFSQSWPISSYVYPILSCCWYHKCSNFRGQATPTKLNPRQFVPAKN